MIEQAGPMVLFEDVFSHFVVIAFIEFTADAITVFALLIVLLIICETHH
jgi:hypothetical protein